VLQLALQLRQAGMRVDVYPDQAKLKNQFKFASDSGYRWTLIVGEEEWSKGVLKLKDFQSGVEVPITLAQMIQGLRAQGVKCKA
jgi:histidyl-tRNA synthetase